MLHTGKTPVCCGRSFRPDPMNDAVAAYVPSLSDRIYEQLRHVEYFRAESAIERRAVYRLRYDSYLQEGAITSRPENVLSDEFDEKGNTLVFGLRIRKTLVASIRLHILNRVQASSPTMQAFGDVLSPLIAAGQTLIDPTRFVVDTDASRRFPDLAYLTLRLPFMAAGHFEAETALAAVRREHMPFYRRVLRYTKVSEPREYLQLTKPLGLMMVSYLQEKSVVISRYPFFTPMPGEWERLFGASAPVDFSMACAIA
jgi:hypothetical protein